MGCAQQHTHTQVLWGNCMCWRCLKQMVSYIHILQILLKINNNRKNLRKQLYLDVKGCVLLRRAWPFIYGIQGGRFKSAGTSGGRHSMKTNAIRYFFFGNSITVYLPLLSIASLSFWSNFSWRKSSLSLMSVIAGARFCNGWWIPTLKWPM